MLAPPVAALRLQLMAMDARSVESSEAVRAISKKAAAAVEGAFAAQMSFLQSASRFLPEVLSGRTPSLFNGVAAERSINAALKPACRTVKANFRRLSNRA